MRVQALTEKSRLLQNLFLDENTSQLSLPFLHREMFNKLASLTAIVRDKWETFTENMQCLKLFLAFSYFSAPYKSQILKAGYLKISTTFL